MSVLLKALIHFSVIFVSLIIFCQSDEKMRRQSIFKFNEDKSILKPFKHSINLSVSFNRNPIRIGTPTVFLLTNKAPSFTFLKPVNSFFINYQYNLKNNFFVEASFTRRTHYYGFSANDFIVFQGLRSSHRTGVSVLSFDFGSGYRIATINNKIRLFDIHTGINIGVTTEKVGTQYNMSNNFTYIDWSGNTGVINVNSTYVVTNRANIGLYFGVSKDFKITENLYIIARFNNYFGKRRKLTWHTYDYSIPALGIANVAHGTSSIKGQTFSIGLKWLFLHY